MSVASALQRVFPDSNVLIEGLFAPWSASRAILILARVRRFRLVLSPSITSNTAHFTPQVAARTGLRIVTPHEFLAQCRLVS